MYSMSTMSGASRYRALKKAVRSEDGAPVISRGVKDEFGVRSPMVPSGAILTCLHTPGLAGGLSLSPPEGGSHNNRPAGHNAGRTPWERP